MIDCKGGFADSGYSLAGASFRALDPLRVNQD